jgi:hypothetical protein
LRNNYLVTDLVLASIEARHEIESDVYIKDVLIPDVDFPSGIPPSARIQFQDCLFGELELDPEVDSENLPRFHGCFIASLEGRVSFADLPAEDNSTCTRALPAKSVSAGSSITGTRRLESAVIQPFMALERLASGPRILVNHETNGYPSAFDNSIFCHSGDSTQPGCKWYVECF